MLSMSNADVIISSCNHKFLDVCIYVYVQIRVYFSNTVNLNDNESPTNNDYWVIIKHNH